MPHTKTWSVGPAASRTAALLALVATPLVGIALARSTWDLASTTARELRRAASPSVATVSLGDGLAVIAGAGGTLVAAHLTLMTVLLVVSPRSSRLRRTVVRITPVTWRRIVGTAAAGALSAGLAVPAVATPGVSDAGWVSETIEQTESVVAEDLGGQAGAVLGAKAQDGAAADESSAHDSDAPARAGEHHIVAPGDSLWSITAEALAGLGDGPSGGDEELSIAAAWPELYEANREAIGDDPGLIHPGERLVLPEGWTR